MSNDYEQWYFLKVQLCAKFPSQRSELYIIYRTILIIGCNNAKEQYYDIYIYIYFYLFIFKNKQTVLWDPLFVLHVFLLF